MVRVLLINDSLSNPNWGDRAAAVSLRRMIAEVGGEVAHFITERSLIFSTFAKPQTYVDAPEEPKARNVLREFIPPVLLSIRRRLMGESTIDASSRLIPQSVDDFDRYLKNALTTPDQYGYLLQAISECDMAIVHGNGCMVGSGIIPRSELFISYLIMKHFDKPVSIVNHTVDFDTPVLKRMAQLVYPMFDDVVFRDIFSAERCEFCNGRFAPDTAFIFEPAAKDEWKAVAGRSTYFDVWPDRGSFDPSTPYICVGGSSGYGFEASESPVFRGYSDLIRGVKQVYDGQIVLTASDLTDKELFRPLAEEHSLPLIGVRTPIQQVVDILGNAEAYVGGRWHPAIFALRGGVPLVPLSAKTFKMQALANMAGLKGPVFDVRGLSGQTEELCRRLEDLLAEGEQLRHRLKSWASHMADNSWDNVAYLSNSVSRRR